MKNNSILFILISFVTILISCERKKTKIEDRKKLILILDTITQNDLDYIINYFKKNDVSFSINGSRSIILISDKFENDQSVDLVADLNHDPNDGSTIDIAQFESKSNNRYVLKKLKYALAISNTNNEKTKIILLSSMIEKSGASSASNENYVQWKNGRFLFADDADNCKDEQIQEANRQLGDTTSWIHKYIVNNKSPNVEVEFSNVNSSDIENSKNVECVAEINNFWKKLSEKINLNTSHNNITHENLNFLISDFLK